MQAIKVKKSGNVMSLEDFALILYKEGQHIVYCDIEGCAKIDDTWYLLDECGNWCYIDETKYEVIDSEKNDQS